MLPYIETTNFNLFLNFQCQITLTSGPEATTPVAINPLEDSLVHPVLDDDIRVEGRNECERHGTFAGIDPCAYFI